MFMLADRKQLSDMAATDPSKMTAANSETVDDDLDISDDEDQDAEDDFPMEEHEGASSKLDSNIEQLLHTLDEGDELNSGQAFIVPDDPVDSPSVTLRTLISVDPEDVMFPQDDILLTLGEIFSIKTITTPLTLIYQTMTTQKMRKKKICC